MLRSQGIKGPSYRFLHGSTKEILNMRKETMSRPMDLSHNIFPRVQPHIYSWLNMYRTNFVFWYGPKPQIVVTELEGKLLYKMAELQSIPKKGIVFTRKQYGLIGMGRLTKMKWKEKGIKGPSYRFLHGSTKEILNMRKETMSRPMDLSHNIFPRVQPHIYSWLNMYRTNFVFWYGPKPQIVVTELEFVKEILNNRDKVYQTMDSEGFLKKLFGGGLVALDGEKWAHRRKLAHYAFHAESLKNMTPAMITSVEIMLERWKQYKGKEIDVFEEFRQLTSDVISRTAFGSSYLEGKDIFEMLMKLTNLMARNAFKIRLPALSLFFKSGDNIESEKLEQGIRDSIIKIIKKREKATSGGLHNFGGDFLGLLLESNHNVDEGNRITEQDMVDECKTFYIAGHETTTSLLSWTVLLLSIHTDWQEKARQEVIKTFGQQLPTSDGIARLKMMNMIIHESLRLYPPVIALLREVKREVKMGDIILPANIKVHVPTLALHHDTQIWGENAHLFKPERFSEGVAKATNYNPAVYLPFGLGPRSCVGLNFATNEAKITLSMILQRYSFTLSPAYIHSPVPVLTISPQRGVQMMLHAL
ncbi:unnamed protein product [Ilex paraguariensis]|uniref:Cytochrome P450 n=1 Tax=Ilex paraguariensis TaxID=185542 RepID=A0ABC8RBW2_9AQUA